MKKDFRKSLPPLTRTRLHELAMRYVARYAATRFMLEQTLQRHVIRAKRARQEFSEAETKKWITEIAEECTRKGYVNDQSFAESTLRVGQKSGWSKLRIAQKLMIKGIAKETVRTLLSEGNDDMQAALIFARRKALGCWRKKKDTDPRKEMEKLCRAGFTPEMARKVIRMSKDQWLETEEELRTKYA
jgi:regulatory protein